MYTYDNLSGLSFFGWVIFERTAFGASLCVVVGQGRGVGSACRGVQVKLKLKRSSHGMPESELNAPAPSADRGTVRSRLTSRGLGLRRKVEIVKARAGEAGAVGPMEASEMQS